MDLILLNVALPVDCWYLILSYTNDPWTFKRTYLTCRQFARIYDERLPKLKKHYTNHLEILLELYPDNDWILVNMPKNVVSWEFAKSYPFRQPMCRLFYNDDITPEIILSNPEFPWTYTMLSRNPNITEDFVEKTIDEDWNWHSLSRHPNISWEFLMKHSDRCDWWYLSSCEKLTWEYVSNNYDKPWNWGILSSNSNITWDIITANPDPPGGYWDNGEISRNPNITWEIVSANPDWEWCWDILTVESAISVDDMLNNSNLPWEWDYLSNKLIGRWDILDNNPQIYRNWNTLSNDPNITWEIIDKYPEAKWKWSTVLSHIDIIDYEDRFERAIKEMAGSMIWFRLSYNPHITPEFVFKHRDKPWYWNALRKNIDIYKFIGDFSFTKPYMTWETATMYDSVEWSKLAYRIGSRNKNEFFFPK